MDYRISKEDGQSLRELAKKQLEFHHREENQRRIKEWYAHNALQGQRPMIHLEAGTFQQEFLPLPFQKPLPLVFLLLIPPAFRGD